MLGDPYPFKPICLSVFEWQFFLNFFFLRLSTRRRRLRKQPDTMHHKTIPAGEVKNINAALKPSSVYFLSTNFIPVGHNFIILKYAYIVEFLEMVSHKPVITKKSRKGIPCANAIHYSHACLCNQGTGLAAASPRARHAPEDDQSILIETSSCNHQFSFQN